MELKNTRKENSLIQTYTVMRILLALRNQCGIEGMLEYIEKYCSHVAQDNPKFVMAVDSALKLTDLDKLYQITTGSK
jgi:hypothetical protein